MKGNCNQISLVRADVGVGLFVFEVRSAGIMLNYFLPWSL